ncbi:MAG TPA: endonuclease MutS2 [Armatimonadota bacterium]|jgi:DNA mismatch repair protein MutS2
MDARTQQLLEFDKVRAQVYMHAATALGRSYVERMRPVRDAQIVRTRMAETNEARLLLTERGNIPLGGLHDVREAVQRADKRGVLTPQELLAIADSAACFRRVRSYFTDAPAAQHLREQGKLISEFARVEQAIAQAISGKGEVLDSASIELERARRRVRGLHEGMQRELQRIISSPQASEQLQDPIITQRNGRFCVPVRAESRNAFKGIVHDLSASGQTVFMEPLAVVEMGNDLREAIRQEEIEIQRVLAALSAAVGREAGAMLASLEAAARLDLIFARALFARASDATEPELNSAGIIDIRQARHPLLGATAVPIDIHLGEAGCTTLLITGPNTGGKTVTLKTVGLLTLMAQSGLHVPAQPGTRLAIVNEVFVDIGDEQSIAQSLSTFSGHMTNIVHILKEAGPNSLVLFDEIGAGTDPAEGAALGKAILLALRDRGCRTIATTHYGELKIFGQSTPGFRNASVEFDLETLRPTYRVISGLPGSSNAFAISQRLGLPKSLIAHAKELMGEAPQAMEQVLKQAEGVRRALDRERTAEAKARKEIESRSAALHSERQALDEKREVALARARQQAQEVLHKARLEANALLDELRVALREVRATSPQDAPSISALQRRTQEVFGRATAGVAELPQAPASPRVFDKPALVTVRVGQAVYVRSLGHRGTALDSGQGEQEVEVQVGIMRVRVPVHDLEAAGNVKIETPRPAGGAFAPIPAKEIHLLGKRAEEAANELDAYLYDALESGLEQVRIVHGFGTGVLRKVVQELLRHHPAVREFRMGQSQEGGGGVTIAELGKP